MMDLTQACTYGGDAQANCTRIELAGSGDYLSGVCAAKREMEKLRIYSLKALIIESERGTVDQEASGRRLTSPRSAQRP